MPVLTIGTSGWSSGTAWRCMFDPIRARLASSCSRNGISAALKCRRSGAAPRPCSRSDPAIVSRNFWWKRADTRSSMNSVLVVQRGVGLRDHEAIFFVGGEIISLRLDESTDRHCRSRRPCAVLSISFVRRASYAFRQRSSRHWRSVTSSRSDTAHQTRIVDLAAPRARPCGTASR